MEEKEYHILRRIPKLIEQSCVETNAYMTDFPEKSSGNKLDDYSHTQHNLQIISI